MKVESQPHEVKAISIPGPTSTNPLMIETPAMPMAAPSTAKQPQGVPAPAAGCAKADTVENKVPVAQPV